MGDMKRAGRERGAKLRITSITFSLGAVVALGSIVVGVLNRHLIGAVAALACGVVAGAGIARARYKSWDAFVTAWTVKRASSPPRVRDSWMPSWPALEIGGVVIGAWLSVMDGCAERVIGCGLVGFATGAFAGIASRAHHARMVQANDRG